MIANAHIKIGRNSYEKLKRYKYLVSWVTNQNSVHEEIKCRLKAGNSCYYSVQTLLSSRLLSKNLKIKIYKTIILPVVLYGCETWSLTLREECRLREFRRRWEDNLAWILKKEDLGWPGRKYWRVLVNALNLRVLQSKGLVVIPVLFTCHDLESHYVIETRSGSWVFPAWTLEMLRERIPMLAILKNAPGIELDNVRS